MNARTLIIKVGALGDVILATPQIARILEQHPGEVWLLTSPPFVPLFAGHPRLKIKSLPRKGVAAMWSALRWLRQQRFDTVYDLQGSDRSRILTHLSGARMRVGLAPRWLYTHSPVQDDIREHVFPRLNRLIESAGLPAAEPQPQFWVEASAQQDVAAWLQQAQLEDRSFVLLHAGASARWPSKRWEAQHFVELARQLETQGLQALWIGGPDDVDLNRELAAEVGRDVTGQFSIPALAELARHARFAIVNDSGPMHVVSTAGIPVYAFFGPTDWRRSHAIGQRERVLTNPVECSPCHLNTCPPARQHACLAEVTPGAVFARLQTDGLL